MINSILYNKCKPKTSKYHKTAIMTDTKAKKYFSFIMSQICITLVLYIELFLMSMVGFTQNIHFLF